MFPRRNSAVSIGLVLTDPPIKVVIRRPVEKSIMDENGFIKTVISFEESLDHGDEKSNYRDYSIQTLISVNAIELLKPVGTLPMSQLSASDLLGDVDVTLANITSRLDDIKKAVAAKSETVDVKTDVKSSVES